MTGNGVLPLSEAWPVETREDRSLLHRAVLLDRTEVLQEPMPRLGLGRHRQHGLVEGVHQAMHLAEQEGASSATTRIGPHHTAAAKERGMIGSIRGVRPAEPDPTRPNDRASFQGDPATPLP